MAGFKADPNSTENEIRFRLQDPGDFTKGSYKRWSEWAGVKAPDGVVFLVGDRDGEKAIQTIRFDKSKWDEEKAGKFWDSIKDKPGFKKHWSWDRNATYVGSCGFNHRNWNNEFYPTGTKESEKLLYYACHLPTVEINATVNLIPRMDTFERWASQTQDDFIFSFRMRLGKKFSSMLEALMRRASATMPSKFGPISIIVPDGLDYARGDAGRLFASLPAHKYAFDIKSHQWLNTEFLKEIEAHDATVVRDHLLGGIINSNWEYIRLPLISALKNAGLDTDLRITAGMNQALPEEKSETYMYVKDENSNPDAKPAAGVAKQLVDKIKSRKPGIVIDLNMIRELDHNSIGEINPTNPSKGTPSDIDAGDPFMEKNPLPLATKRNRPKDPITEDTSFVEGVDDNGGLTEPSPKVWTGT